MPRTLPRYDLAFARSIAQAAGYTGRIEQARVSAQVANLGRVTIGDLELSYELAYLRTFLAWELLLEATLQRLICGYRHSGGQEPLSAGQMYAASLAAAEAAILGGQRYRLWHDPAQVIARTRRFLNGSRYELVLSSAQGRIELFACVRHRIAHSQKDAIRRFDGATMTLAARRYRGARPGRFLRDWTIVGGIQVRWLQAISSELEGIAFQLCA